MSLQIFSHIFRLFSVLLRSIGSPPQIQPNVPGFIPNSGVPVRKAWTPLVLIGRARTIGWCHLFISLVVQLFHLEVCGARGVLVIPKWLSSVLQVVEFSDPSFVFAPARDCHNTIFCPFRFKSSVLALLLDGSSLAS